jgi:hypothetical protein
MRAVIGDACVFVRKACTAGQFGGGWFLFSWRCLTHRCHQRDDRVDSAALVGHRFNTSGNEIEDTVAARRTSKAQRERPSVPLCDWESCTGASALAAQSVTVALAIGAFAPRTCPSSFCCAEAGAIATVIGGEREQKERSAITAAQ